MSPQDLPGHRCLVYTHAPEPDMFLIGEHAARGDLVPLLPGWRLPDIDVLALYASRRHLSAKVRIMVDFLAEAFRHTQW
ncbi:MAG: hypothetical protein KGJ57_19865 [Sphingomonadales bacterium]|nr:hypothetical protein [Sphingomonadales bacterium]MDE2171652.1 hypothetical protein [Sphingomonadales bacterium]